MKKYLLILLFTLVILISGCSQENSDITGKVVAVPTEKQSEDVIPADFVVKKEPQKVVEDVPKLKITDLECSTDSLGWTSVKGTITNIGIKTADYVIMDVYIFNEDQLIQIIRAVSKDMNIKHISLGESVSYYGLEKDLSMWTRCEAYTEYSEGIIQATRKTKIIEVTQVGDIIKELNSLYDKERDSLNEMYEDYRDELYNDCSVNIAKLNSNNRFDEASNLIDLCSENVQESLYYWSEEADDLLNLWSDTYEEILNKKQDTDVDLTVYYKELSKDFSKKAREGRNRFADRYEVLSSTISISTSQTSTNAISSSDYECSYNKYDCDNFSTHAQAQEVYLYCIGLGAGNIHHLDGDDDGLACEALYYEENTPSHLNFGIL